MGGDDTERTQASHHLRGRFAAQDHAAERPIFETGAYAYWARIGHRFDVINYELADMHSLPAIAPGLRGEDRGVAIGLPAGVELGDQDVQELARE